MAAAAPARALRTAPLQADRGRRAHRAARARRVPARRHVLQRRRARTGWPPTRCPSCCRATSATGPVFSVRILHGLQVFLLGPEANHHVLVSNAANFRWREGGFGELEPLLGDGLLTIDGAYHRRARRIMLPALPPRPGRAAAADAMFEEAERALEPWRAGQVIDVYAWARELAMRIAMRALLGLDPDDRGTGALAAREFERALAFYGTDYRAARPARAGLAVAARCSARARCSTGSSTGEIERRRATGGGQRGHARRCCMAATDEDGSPAVRPRGARPGGHSAVRGARHVHLHDLASCSTSWPATRTSWRRCWQEQDARARTARRPRAEHLAGGMPRLDMALDETLRLYPPAWIGPRLARRALRAGGRRGCPAART